MILTLCAFVLLGLLNPLRVSAIPSPDVLGPIISFLTFLLGFVSLGFGILTGYMMRVARLLTPKTRRIAWVALCASFFLLLAGIGVFGWYQYKSASVPPPSFPPVPVQTTSTIQVVTTTIHTVPPVFQNDLISSRVASSTILVPTSILKEVVAQPGWDQGILLLDIREKEERDVGVVDASTTWMRYGDLIHGGQSTLPRDRDILVICWTSMRGSETVAWLRSHGIPRAFAVKGGLQGVLEADQHGWIPDGLPWTGDTNWSTAFDPFEYPKLATLTKAKALYDAGAVIIDVREPQLFSQGHIDRAFSLPLRSAPTSLVSSTLAQLSSPYAPILIYADGYVNTFYAKVLGLRLSRLGYTQALLLIDKNHLWQKQGYPVKTSPVMTEE